MSGKKLTFLILFGLTCCWSFFLIQKNIKNNFFNYDQVSSTLDHDKDKNSYAFLILYTKGLGEKEWAKRLQIAANNLGWKGYVVSSHQTFLQKLFLHKPLDRVVKKTSPDFMLILEGNKKLDFPIPQYLCLSGGKQKYLKKHGKHSISKTLPFDAYLPAFADIDGLKKEIEAQGKIFRGMHFYPTCAKTDFSFPTPHRIAYSGANWDKKRSGKEYQTLFWLLDKNDYLDVYGPKRKWNRLMRSYRGSLPFDGVSVTNALHKAGIALLLHADSHLQGNAPTSRIFEAAAASCVIISDRHPFIEKEFKNHILYIDENLSGREIFEQIEIHLNWIKEHPVKSLKKSKKIHRKFVRKFTLESQLNKLGELHEKIMKEKSLES